MGLFSSSGNSIASCPLPTPFLIRRVAVLWKMRTRVTINSVSFEIRYAQINSISVNKKFTIHQFPLLLCRRIILKTRTGMTLLRTIAGWSTPATITPIRSPKRTGRAHKMIMRRKWEPPISLLMSTELSLPLPQPESDETIAAQYSKPHQFYLQSVDYITNKRGKGKFGAPIFFIFFLLFEAPLSLGMNDSGGGGQPTTTMLTNRDEYVLAWMDSLLLVWACAPL